jgi:hypothetical protein
MRRAVFAILIMVLISGCRALAFANCDTKATSVQAFGKTVAPLTPIDAPATLRSQLPATATITHIVEGKLSPGGERLIFYDSSQDDPDNPTPTLAIEQKGRVVRRYILADALDDAGGGLAHLIAYCKFSLDGKRDAIAIALQTAGDGTGSGFLILVWEPSGYRFLFNHIVGQGRMVLSPPKGEFTVWETLGDGDCVWCPGHYVTKLYRIGDAKAVEISSSKPAKVYNPAEVTQTPLIVDEGKRVR